MGVIHKPEIHISKPVLSRISQLKAVLQGYRSRLDEELAPQGITTAQLRMLWTIAENPRASGAQIARSCAITPQSGQETIARMESLGWIRRHASEESERVLVSELTAKGRKILEDARTVAQRLDHELWDGIPEGELAGLDAALDAAVERLQGQPSEK